MSGITANDACNDCLTSAQHLNSTEIYFHSHIDEDDELLKYIWREYLHPKQYEWVLIAGYIIVFLVSLVGNTLDEIYPKVYHTCFFIVTYFAPLCLMVLAYIQICHKLWCQQIPGTSSVLQRKWKSLQCSAHAVGSGESVKVRTSTVSAEIKQVKARRKTARMLMVVLFVFALCYLPISVLNIMKRKAFTFNKNKGNIWKPSFIICLSVLYLFFYAWFTFSHWLIYANSAANPIIYNFLSGKFREEFKAAFICHCSGRDETHKERVRARTSTDSRKSLSTQVNNFDNISRISDQAM
uniref:Hypocretin (orexin) receptor 2 n=1 Tax=Sinocyclocheilus rhinocerous TaxID=307959 RepID=A0A673FS38_9TELE